LGKSDKQLFNPNSFVEIEHRKLQVIRQFYIVNRKS